MRDADLLSKIDFEYIVLDESQYIKNRSSKIFQSLRKLNASHRITLSGTPIENSLSDLWSQMDFLNPGLMNSQKVIKQDLPGLLRCRGISRRQKGLRN
jgi:non-specific serine/threonine protein kinase